ncbi:dihydroxyacetone kinase subunit DhaK [Fulvimarina sp. MAC3]|uniref:dihydroxyacetone kinase subunit DhaK n=1 Tax=Fulvimarina sp. MAC3 TaxID=3148887 RepID=UPI0031FC1611
MDYFVNSRETIVDEALDGLIRISGGRLTRLDGYPHIRVVARTERDPQKVAVISGGGSGHEPAHAGFVGRGMLTAAVCGSIFASPSVDAVLAGILAVTGEAGCLLIVKNYTGDRLNFGLAAQRARALGKSVEMVIVADDVALPEIDQKRGLAGTLFVHKIAGALCDEGRPLEEVAAIARRVAASAVSIGMSLTPCHVPGGDHEADRIAEGKAELGLGIHGEPGAETVAHTDAAGAMGKIVEKLEQAMTGDGPIIALLNDLGGLTGLEGAILANELLSSPLGSRITRIAGPAPLMTSLDMRGFSVSLLPAEDAFVEALERPAEPHAWAPVRESVKISPIPLPDGLTPERAAPSKDERAEAVLTQVCEALLGARDALDRLDAHSGDGDTGATLASAANALLDDRDRLPLAEPSKLLEAIGLDLTKTMGGSSGVLLSLFFASAGEALSDGRKLPEALEAGLNRMKEAGGAERGDRTMIDALEPAIDSLLKGGSVEEAAKAAREGADETAEMGRAGAGRSAYVRSEELKGHKDPGAEAVAIAFEALGSL